MAKTFKDLCTDINDIGTKIKNLHGTLNYTSKYPSITDIKNSLNTIPQTIIQGGTYNIICADTAATTFTLSKNGTTIDTKTNDATIGGSVMFTPTEIGEYTITATQNGTTKWTNTIVLNDVGVYNCKCGNLLDTYSEDEIDLACKNHYARYMWNLGDFKNCSSFVGSTSADYVKRYIIGFYDDELSDGTGYAEITWCWLYGTPSTYRMSTGINNMSYEGSLGRQYCIPNGTDYYVYDSSVTSTTEGTYYIHDTTTGTWEAKTLPAEYIDTADYYTKNTTSEDGAIYAGIPTDLISRFVATKQKTWVGMTNQESSLTINDRRTSTNIITTNDKIFILSGHRVFNNSIFSTAFNYNNMNGSQYKYFKEYSDGYIGNLFGTLSKKWFRDPALNSVSSFCDWEIQGYVGYSGAGSNFRLPICACQ